ncbi:MAG: 50S ribosomal protein L19 [Candidatus Dojkabacteria bacterium]|nr:50S ribosomal protein L19 [Candidatus Dojkabacteria bacterium]MDQ7020290.1 50S ribosomal protein L19 [Candidatus Dojkabacteria bacterium]
MSQEQIKQIQSKYMGVKRPEVKTGDTVTVHTIIRDGDKRRIQKFKGMVMSTNGSGTDKMFTVRKITKGVGVEKILPLYSTNIEKIEVEKHASVRRSKLYYMRDRIGKAAMKLKPGAAVIEEEIEVEEPVEEEVVVEEASLEAQEEIVEEKKEDKSE